MRVFRILSERIKQGLKIAEDCYLVGGTRDSVIIKFKGRRIEVFMERLPGKPSRLIYPSKQRRWLPPHGSEPVTDAEYEYIIDAVAKDFEHRGEVVERRPPH